MLLFFVIVELSPTSWYISLSALIAASCTKPEYACAEQGLKAQMDQLCQEELSNQMTPYPSATERPT